MPDDGVELAAAVVAGAEGVTGELIPRGAAGHNNPLKRSLSTWDLTSLGVGGIVGAGIYVLTGQAAALYAGPAVVISFIVSGVACAFSALCYSELAAMMPVAGSAYSFASATLGPFLGWVIGWDLVLEYMMGAATVAVGWSGYANSLLKDMGVPLPQAIAAAPFSYDSATDTWAVTGGIINLPAVLITLAMAGVNMVGIRESAMANNVIVGIKVTVLLIFIGVGSAYVQPDNWTPFVPPEKSLGVFGPTGIFRGAAVVFFSYVGFDAISTAAQEAVDPQRSLPIATIASLAICTALYIAVGLVLTGLVPYAQLNVADPIAVAVDAAGPALFWLRPVIKVGAILGLTSVIMVLLLGQSRIFFAMAEDGVLPRGLGAVNRRFQTPITAISVAGIGAAIVAGLLPIGVLGEMVSIGTLFAFVLVCAGVIRLRRKRPDLPRPFRTPWVPFTPIMGILTALGQMVALPLGTWWRLLAWQAAGLAVYFLYARGRVDRRGERASLMDLDVVAQRGVGGDGGDAAAASVTPLHATGGKATAGGGPDAGGGRRPSLAPSRRGTVVAAGGVGTEPSFAVDDGTSSEWGGAERGRSHSQFTYDEADDDHRTGIRELDVEFAAPEQALEQARKLVVPVPPARGERRPGGGSTYGSAAEAAAARARTGDVSRS